MRLNVTACLLLTLACRGQITEPARPPAVPPVVPPIEEPRRACRPVAAPMRQLTARQYDAIVADLLGDTTRPAQVLQRPQTDERFDNDAVWVGTDEVRLRFYLKAAETLATTAVAAQATRFACSNPAVAQEEACLGIILDTFGRRAFRRSLNTDERANLLGVFRSVRTLEGAVWSDALSAVVQVLLQSPQFLYITEAGTKVAGATRPTSRLTPLEVATKLSLFYWGTGPDLALLDAAEQGRLVSRDDVARESTRLLNDPRARSGYLNFATQWLDLDLPAVAKNATSFPAWNQTVADAARTELQTFVADAYAARQAYAYLLTNQTAAVGAALAGIYGVAPPAMGIESRQLPANRAGVLTRVAWLAGHSHPDQTSPTLRGKAIRTRFLCNEIAPPPPGVSVMLPNVAGPATLRQRLAAHMTAGSTCASCHTLMDPIGFGLEGFDAIGAFRTTEPNGLPIDATGEILGGAFSGTFEGGAALSAKLAQSPDANRCYLTQVYRFAQGRRESSLDRCHLDAAMASLPPGASLQDVGVAVTTSGAFLFREALP